MTTPTPTDPTRPFCPSCGNDWRDSDEVHPSNFCLDPFHKTGSTDPTKPESANFVHVHQPCEQCKGCKLECDHGVTSVTTSTSTKPGVCPTCTSNKRDVCFILNEKNHETHCPSPWHTEHGQTADSTWPSLHGTGEAPTELRVSQWVDAPGFSGPMNVPLEPAKSADLDEVLATYSLRVQELIAGHTPFDDGKEASRWRANAKAAIEALIQTERTQAERLGELRVLEHVTAEEFDIKHEGADPAFTRGIEAGINAVKHFANQRRMLMLYDAQLPKPPEEDKS